MQPIQHISIPNPCTASWSEMTPNTAGRHCLHCAKTVVDFSAMTDAEVIGYINTSGKACGRFGESQLVRINHLLEEKPKGGFSWKGLAAAASLLILSTTGRAEARNTVKTEQGPTAFKPVAEVTKADSLTATIIKGKIIDKADNTPIIGASIQVKGTQTGTMTNVNGTFTLTTLSPEAIVVVRSLGYKTQEIAFSQLQSNPNICLELEATMLGEPVFVSYKKAPFYKRWFYKVKRLF